ncbi:MAG: hypothetical protein GY737_13915 [Desulfobacteraceae bacterium]|nr:hypothetical protein [Desulfobacteraceae bacterium]
MKATAISTTQTEQPTMKNYGIYPYRAAGEQLWCVCTPDNLPDTGRRGNTIVSGFPTSGKAQDHVFSLWENQAA